MATAKENYEWREPSTAYGATHLCESEWVGVCYFTNSTEMIHGVDGQEIEGDRKMNIKYIFENGGWKENKNETETFPQFV